MRLSLIVHGTSYKGHQAIAQEVDWVDWRPEGCWFDSRLPLAERRGVTAPDALAVALRGWLSRCGV